MLLLPLKKIWYIHVIIISSILVLIASIGLITIQLLVNTNPDFRYATSEQFIDDLTHKSLIHRFIIFPQEGIIFLFIVSLVILGGILFIWTPNLTALGVRGETVKMIWDYNRFHIPERQLLIDAPTGKICVRRKHSSLKGVFSQEYILELSIAKDDSVSSFISDFGGKFECTETSTHIILTSTVKFEYLPLKIFQIRALLAAFIK